MRKRDKGFGATKARVKLLISIYDAKKKSPNYQWQLGDFFGASNFLSVQLVVWIQLKQ